MRLMTGDHDKTHVHAHDDAFEGWWVLIISFVILFFGLYLRYSGNIGLLSKGLLIGAMGISGYKIAYKGLKALFFGNITIDLLVTIAAIGAIAIGHLEEGTSVIILFNVAERLEAYATDAARKSIRSLMNLRPEIAIIQKDNLEIEVPVENVLPGEIFIVRPGDRIPLDGRIIEGVSSVNQATITGESQPLLKEIGEEVYAGTINIDGYLSAKTIRMAQETVLSKILRMVEEAEESKSATEAFVDRFSSWYTPTIIILAILVATLPPILLQDSFEHWIYRSLVMLVVACPCALAIATPVAMVSSITSASRNGVLIKGSTYIEQMSNAGVFAFDKTGTLTKGELEVSEIISFGLPEKEILRRAVALEAKSTHPIAKAIIEKGNKHGIIPENVTDFRSHVGRGVEACLDEKTCIVGNLRLFQDLKIDVIDEMVNKIESKGKTVVLVAEEGKIVGAIALMDKIREDALESIRDLEARGIRVEMLTGDNLETAKVTAERLNVNGYQANLLPDEKVKAVDKLRGIDSVVMVGDGVNDAPALAAADVGIAMGAMGSDIALETADIALMKDDLSKIDYALSLSKATMYRVKENIAISLIVKLAVAALAFPGLITLWLAVVVGDAGLSLIVVLNSLRLGGIKADKN